MNYINTDDGRYNYMNKSLRKTLAILTSILSITLFISGCGKNSEKDITKEVSSTSKEVVKENNSSDIKNNNDTKNSDNKDANKEINKYSEELSKIFLGKENGEYIYTGTLDYSHKVILKNLNKTDEVLTINFDGEIEDLSGGESKTTDSNIFKLKYIINKDSVREVYDKTIKKPQKPFAIDRVILKAPLKEGSTFSNEYIYKNKKYNGETKIDEITNNGKIIKTTTIIKGIEEFKNKEFKEVRQYEVGKGLVSTSFNTDIEGLDFSYKLFKIN